jgi:2,4-dienoyl-CoA reductase-like NADH-dependent reductase (Old Yellow Enzyme family)
MNQTQRARMAAEITTATSDDTKTMFSLLYKLEQHCADRNMNAREAEIAQIIRKLNAMGFRETAT